LWTQIGSSLKKKSKKKDKEKVQAVSEPEPEAEPVVQAPAGGKYGKKAPGKEEEDLDALLAEFGMKADPKAEPAGKGKKKKGKGGAAKAAGEEEDIDALLAEFGSKPAEAAPAAAAGPAVGEGSTGAEGRSA
jgi:hypothetical protein